MGGTRGKPVKLTRTAIERLSPRDRRYSVSIEGYPGLELRVSPKSVKTFSIVYRTPEGGRERYTIGRYGQVTPELVAKKAKQLSGRVAEGLNPQAEKRETRRITETPTLAEFITGQYSDWVETNQRSGHLTVTRLRGAFRELLETRLDRLTSWDIECWRSKRIKAGISKATLNRDLAAIRGAFTRAVDWQIIGNNPLGAVKSHKVGKFGRTRYLGPDEEKRLKASLELRETQIREKRARYEGWRRVRGQRVQFSNETFFVDHLRPMVLLALNTGLRRGEIFSLQWKDVDLSKRNLRVLNSASKNNQTRDIPLNDDALEVLSEWRAQQSDAAGLVFPSRTGNQFNNVKRSWARVLDTARIEDFTWHDLRHTFASNLVMAGVDLNTIRELLGHSDISMTLRYSHLAPEHKAAAVARLVGKASDGN